jgi:L,D-peptidoglycan transpeptidase YkuD (ErfK/YbiS/YcfS/YnhG family)
LGVPVDQPGRRAAAPAPFTRTRPARRPASGSPRLLPAVVSSLLVTAAPFTRTRLARRPALGFPRPLCVVVSSRLVAAAARFHRTRPMGRPAPDLPRLFCVVVSSLLAAAAPFRRARLARRSALGLPRLLCVVVSSLLVVAASGCGTAAGEVAAPASGVATPQPGRPVAGSPEPGASAAASVPPAPAATTGAPGRTTAPAHPTTAAPARTRGTGGAPGQEETPANDAARLRTLPASTTQVVIVQSAAPSATTATLQTYAKSGGAWRPVLGPLTARLGGRGFSDAKHEGDRTTPAGVFAIDATMYGIAADPGVRYGYHQLVADDWWNENSDSPGYNTFSHGPNPGGPSEPLWQISPQYTYFAVIRYNMPATPGRGSGIFLHQSTGNSTLGCVSLTQGDLLAVLRWLDPAANPRIVMAPTSWLGRY